MKQKIVILFFIVVYIAPSQGLPGGQYERHEEQVVKNHSEPKAMISLNYKHIANDEYSMNDVGVKLGLFATENIFIGVNYFYLFDQSVIFSPEMEGVSAALRFDYYGFNFDYFLTNNKTLPISLGLNIGFGQMTFSNFSGAPANRDLTGDWVSIIEPEMTFYFYIIPRVVANFNVGYRSVSGVEYKNINDNDLSGFVGGLGIGLVLF